MKIGRAVNNKLKTSQPQPKPNPKRVHYSAIKPLSIRLRTQTAGEAPYGTLRLPRKPLFSSRSRYGFFTTLRYVQIFAIA